MNPEISKPTEKRFTLPVHKAIEVGIPPRLTLLCAPSKLTGVVRMMLDQSAATEIWGKVTCLRCREERGWET